MLTRINPAIRRILISMGALLVSLWPAIALAQTAAPSPALRRAPAPWIGMLVMAVLLGVVVVVSLMPSKRSHQD